MPHITVTCDGSQPFSRLHHVWEEVTSQLRDTHDKLRKMNSELYGKHDWLAYMSSAHESLHAAQEPIKSVSTVRNYYDLEKLNSVLVDCGPSRSNL